MHNSKRYGLLTVEIWLAFVLCYRTIRDGIFMGAAKTQFKIKCRTTLSLSMCSFIRSYEQNKVTCLFQRSWKKRRNSYQRPGCSPHAGPRTGPKYEILGRRTWAQCSSCSRYTDGGNRTDVTCSSLHSKEVMGKGFELGPFAPMSYLWPFHDIQPETVSAGAALSAHLRWDLHASSSCFNYLGLQTRHRIGSAVR